MKLLDKIMAQFGYVPKGYSENRHKIQDFQQDSFLLNNSFHKYECFDYSISRVGFFYEVKIYWMYDLMKAKITIKRFFTDDADYARICAEELCEKLNERI